MSLTLTSIHRYPVKSMRGHTLDTLEVEPWGLAGDRRWMVVEGERGPGTFLSARKDPWLATMAVEVVGDDLVLHPPLGVAAPPLAARRPAGDAEHRDVTVWGSTVPAAVADAEATAWLSTLAGRDVRLVFLDDPTVRATNPAFSAADDRVSFADGYPLLLTTQASLAALGDAIVEASQGAEEPASMARFRPNVVVDGDLAWAEDDWRLIRIGDVRFRAVKGCARCVMTTVDPDTGLKGREPLRTLGRTRRFDSGVWFGINLVPDLSTDGPHCLTVGAPVEVLDAVPAGSGPLR